MIMNISYFLFCSSPLCSTPHCSCSALQPPPPSWSWPWPSGTSAASWVSSGRGWRGWWQQRRPGLQIIISCQSLFVACSSLAQLRINLYCLYYLLKYWISRYQGNQKIITNIVIASSPLCSTPHCSCPALQPPPPSWPWPWPSGTSAPSWAASGRGWRGWWQQRRPRLQIIN